MTKMISIHSFRGGTGKSTITANLATTLAHSGKRVAIVDTDIQSPGVHILFGLSGDREGLSLNDFVWGDAELRDAAIDVTPPTSPQAHNDADNPSGVVFLVPASSRASDITDALRDGYDPQRLVEGLRSLCIDLELDILLIDTHPGLNEETLLALIISELVIIVLRPDQQDFEGTGIAVEIARQLDVPDLRLLVNKAPRSLDSNKLGNQVAEAYGLEVLAVFSHEDDIMELASEGVLINRNPDHELAQRFVQLANDIS